MNTQRRMWMSLLVLIVIFAGGGWTPATQAAYADKISPLVLEDTANGQEAAFLIVLKDQAELVPVVKQSENGKKTEAAYAALAGTAQRSQKGVLAALTRQGIPYRTFTLVNAVAVKGDITLVEQMAARLDVAYIAADRTFRLDLEEPEILQPVVAAPAAVEWNVAKVNADDLWALGITGTGIVYGNADTGIDWDHPALISHYRGWNGSTANHAYSWWDAVHEEMGGGAGNDCGYSSVQPCDDHGHGTHTTGTGVGGEGSNQIGVAPGAKWIGCRNMEDGNGSTTTYLECLDFMLAPWDMNGDNPNPALHADVISNSYTCTASEGCNTDDNKRIMQQAVENLRAAGIFVSASAGNAGSGCSTITDPPAIEDSVITVGWTNNDDTISSSSSRGRVTVAGLDLIKPDLVAPGTSVRSANRSGGYTFMSGTSMAAPAVAGVVTLLWSRFPSLRGDVDATETLLKNSALHLMSEQCGDAADAVPNNVFGYGLVDALAAYQANLPVIYIPLVLR